jgi:hypothetical protein
MNVGMIFLLIASILFLFAAITANPMSGSVTWGFFSLTLGLLFERIPIPKSTA